MAKNNTTYYNLKGFVFNIEGPKPEKLAYRIAEGYNKNMPEGLDIMYPGMLKLVPTKVKTNIDLKTIHKENSIDANIIIEDKENSIDANIIIEDKEKEIFQKEELKKVIENTVVEVIEKKEEEKKDKEIFDDEKDQKAEDKLVEDIVFLLKRKTKYDTICEKYDVTKDYVRELKKKYIDKK